MKTRLSEIITARGLDLKVVAKDLGIEKRTLNNYVNEKTLMNSDMIKRVAEYLKVSTDYLLDFSVENEFIDKKIDELTYTMKEIVYHLKK